MKISIFTNNGALNSAPIFSSISKGLIKLNHTIIYNEYDADMFVIWSVLFQGRMVNNKQVWEYAQHKGIPIIIIEVSAIKRNVLWRVCVNGITLPTKTFQYERYKRLNINMKPWDRTGEHILICGQKTSSQLWKHGNIHEWLLNKIEETRKYTDRQIIFRPHPREPYFNDLSSYNVLIQQPIKIPNTYDDYDFSLHNSWAVINSSSTPAIQSIINGIPVITDDHNLAYPMSTPLAKIEQPCYHQREEWLNQLCHLEWYQHELEDPDILSNILIDVLRD